MKTKIEWFCRVFCLYNSQLIFIKGVVMKNKWSLVSAIIQLVIGTLVILSFFVLWANGEDMTRWIITFILSVAFVVLGVIGIIDYKTQK